VTNIKIKNSFANVFLVLVHGQQGGLQNILVIGKYLYIYLN